MAKIVIVGRTGEETRQTASIDTLGTVGRYEGKILFTPGLDQAPGAAKVFFFLSNEEALGLAARLISNVHDNL
jgi:hypothetical protein